MAGMAGVELPEGVFDHQVPGAVRCRAPLCANWMIKRSGRHIYCKAPNCTYKRGQPGLIQEPEGAADEVLIRLQDPETGEVGPSQLGDRRRAVSEAAQAGDRPSLYGALVDEAVACIAFADRVQRGERHMVVAVTAGRPGKPASPRPVGLAAAVVASHQRTYRLAEARVEAIWTLLSTREHLASAEAGVAQMAGGPREPEAQAVRSEAAESYERAQRALESLEAAWRERAQTLVELSTAAQTLGAAAQNGSATG